MGNKLGRRRSVVDEKYTKSQGLYQHRDIDIKKLKKLILESKLAPCYPGDEDCRCDLEECPICFLSYPSLNRSRCCSKSICTECFLQLKMPNATRPTQCPFCKTSNYAVEYRGTKTKKEKSMEQVEEQLVIETKIRMRQQELQEEEEKLQQRQETYSSNRRITSSEGTTEKQRECACYFLQDAYAWLTSTPPASKASRDGGFSVDLDDIMFLEAIWLSMQKNSRSISVDLITSEHDFKRDVPYITLSAPPASSSASGLANAIATLVEHQQTGRECSTSYENNALSLSRLPGQGMIHGIQSQHVDPYHEFHTAHDSRYVADQESQCGFSSISGLELPESFQERMTLAMTLSLAEAHTPLPANIGLAPRH